MLFRNVFTQIPHPLHLYQLFSLSSSSATCLHSTSFCRVPSQQSPTKSNPLPSLMACDIALIVFIAAASAAECGKQAVDTSLLLFHLNRTLSQWILSNYLITLYTQLQHFGAAITKAFPFVRQVKYQPMYLKSNGTAQFCILFACVLVCSPVKAWTDPAYCIT